MKSAVATREAVSTEPAQVIPQTGAIITPDALLRIAVERNDGDLARLERLANMVKEWRAEQARIAFEDDFLAFRAENVVIPKTRPVDMRSSDGRQGPKFKQSELDVVIRMLTPALARHGFSIRHDQRFGSVRWMIDGKENDVPRAFVKCILTHRAGHSISCELEGPPAENKVLLPVMQMQWTATYLKRKATLAITGTPDTDDDIEEEGAWGDQPTQHGAEKNQDSALADAGNSAAKKGMPALLEWWQGLTEAQRKEMTPLFGAMRATAGKVRK